MVEFVLGKQELPPKCLSVGSTRKARSRGHQERIPDPTAFCSRPTTKTFIVISTGKGPGEPARAAKAKFRSSTSARTTSSRIRSCSPMRGRRREVRAGRYARRCGWRSLGLQQCGAASATTARRCRNPAGRPRCTRSTRRLRVQLRSKRRPPPNAADRRSTMRRVDRRFVTPCRSQAWTGMMDDPSQT